MSDKKFDISSPPTVGQERIVAILDRFDAPCNDLTIGLRAEIEARRKQYEYFPRQFAQLSRSAIYEELIP